MNESNHMPSKWLYVLSALIFLVGIGLFVFFLVSGLSESIDQLGTSILMPGTEQIELAKPGRYTIFLEYNSVFNGRVYQTSNIDGLLCMLTNVETGEPVHLTSPRANSNYSINGREGRSIFQFEIEIPGTYELSGRYESEAGETVVLVVNKGFGSSLIRTILLSVGILLITLFASLATLIYTAAKRKVNKVTKS